jgi:hypothetical protein
VGRWEKCGAIELIKIFNLLRGNKLIFSTVEDRLEEKHRQIEFYEMQEKHPDVDSRGIVFRFPNYFLPDI